MKPSFSYKLIFVLYIFHIIILFLLHSLIGPFFFYYILLLGRNIYKNFEEVDSCILLIRQESVYAEKSVTIYLLIGQNKEKN